MEIEQIRGTSWIRIFLQSFSIFHFRFAFFISILSYVLLGNYINTQQVNIQVENTYYKQAWCKRFFPFYYGLGQILFVHGLIGLFKNLQAYSDKSFTLM